MAFVGGRHLKKGGAYFKVALVSSLVKMSLFHRCSKDFGSKNQVPGLSIIGTLVENGLKEIRYTPKSLLLCFFSGGKLNTQKCFMLIFHQKT